MSPDDAFDDLTAALRRQSDGGDGDAGGSGGGHGEVKSSAVFSIHTMKACRLFVAYLLTLIGSSLRDVLFFMRIFVGDIYTEYVSCQVALQTIEGRA